MRRALPAVPLVVAPAAVALIAPPVVAILLRDLGQHRLLVLSVRRCARRSGRAVVAHLPSVPPTPECLDGGQTGTVQRMEVSMVEPSKITDKAAQIAAQIAAAAGPAKDKAAELAATAAAAAGPIASQAKGKAAELAERAGEAGAKGVGALAEGLDKATGGKYSDRISSVTSKLEERLDPGNPTDDLTPPPAPPAEPSPTT